MALNPLSFSATITGNVTQKLKEIESELAKIKDDFTFKVNLDPSSMASFKSTLENLNGEGLKNLTEGMKNFREEAAKVKLNDFAGNMDFEGAITKLKELKATYDKFMSDWKSMDGHGDQTKINAMAFATSMKQAIAEAQQAMTTAWSHASTLTPEAANKLQGQLASAFGNLHTIIQQQISAGLMPNTGLLPDIKKLETQIGQIGKLGENLGPMSGYITNAADVAGILATAFQQVEDRLQLLKSSLASDDFERIAKSAAAAAESVDKLTASFGPLLSKLGENQELKNFMTGLGEIVNSIRLLTKNSNALGVTAGKNISADQMAKNLAINVQKIDVAYKRIAEAQDKIRYSQDLGKSLRLTDSDPAMAQLQRYMQYLDELKVKLAALRSDASLMSKSGATGVLLGPEYSYTLQAINKAESAMRRMAAGTGEASGKVKQLTVEEEQLARAIQNATNSASKQNQVLSDLKSMALQYLSVYGAYGFVKEMAQVTGELELQKTALASILDSASTASDMYGQIRDLSQMSPFSFMDLMKSTRQLAAFGIETKDLYSTMKALSDIGAGLNVDVNRLILAYGHTRSYGYLSGIQNRQFENAGIDMIGGLVKKYNELADAERRAGRAADNVSRKDIFSRMRDKSIPFEDVQDVIMSLDEPGGKFYNMQQKQFETLGGKLRNLANNYNIMLSEMGQSTHGFLMGAVNSINALTENWAKYGQIVADVVVSLGAAKVALLAINGFKFNLGKGATAFNAAINSMRMMDRSKWAVGYNNVGSSSQVGTLGTAYGRMVAQSKELTQAQKVQAVLHKRVSDSAIQQLATERVITAEYAKRIQSMGTFRRGLERARISVKMFGAELKAAFFNPTTAIFAVVGAVFSLWNYFRGLRATIASITNSTREDAFKDANALSQFRTERSDMYGMSDKEISDEVTKRRAVIRKAEQEAYNQWSASNPLLPGQTLSFDKTEIAQKYKKMMDEVEGNVLSENRASRLAAIESKGAAAVLDEVREELENMDPLYNGDLFNVNKFKDEAEQALEIIDRLRDIENARNFVAEHSGDYATANDKTHNILTDSFAEDVKDYEGYIQKVNGELSQVSYAAMDKFIKDNQEYFENIAKQYQLDMVKNRSEIFKYGLEEIVKNNDERRYQISKNGPLGGLLTAMYQKNNAAQELQPEFVDMGRTAAKHFIDGFREGTINSSNYSIVVADMTKKLLESDEYKVSDPEAQNRVITQLMLDLPNRVFSSLARSSEGETTERSKQTIQAAFEATNQYIEGVAGPRLVEAFKGIATEANDVTTPEAQAAVQRVCAAMENEFAGFTSWLGTEGNNWTEIIKSAFEQARPSKDDQWKIDANQYFSKSVLGPIIGQCQNAIEWLDKARKKVKETKEVIDGQKAHFEIELGIGATGSAQAFLDAYKKKYGQDLAGSYKWSMTSSVTQNEYDTARTLYQSLFAMDNIKAYKDATGYDLDPQKNKKTSKKSSTANKDKTADEWLELLRIIKEAYAWYKKWEKEVGKTAALAMVRNQFKNLLPDDVLKDIEHYDNYVQSIMDKAQARIDKLGKKDSKGYIYEKNRDVIKTGNGLKEDFQYQTFQEQSKNYSDHMSNALDLITDKYETFRKVLEATGDKDLATRLLGEDFQWQNKAEVIRKWIENVLQTIGAVDKINLDAELEDKTYGNGGKVTLSLAGNEAIEDYVKNALGEVDENGHLTEDSAKRIDGVTAILKTWRDAQKGWIKDSLTEVSDILKEAVDYRSQVERLEGERTKKLTDIGYLNGDGTVNKNASADAKKAAGLVSAKYDLQITKTSTDYWKLMNSTLKSAYGELQPFVTTFRDKLLKALETGGITAEEYAKQIDEIDKKMRDLDMKRSDTANYFEGGINNVLQSRYDDAMSQATQYANDYQKFSKLAQDNSGNLALKGFYNGQASSALSNMQGAESAANMAQGAMSTLAIIDKIINGINDVVQNIKKILDDIAEAATYMGGDSKNVTNSRFYGFMSAFSQSSQGAADSWNNFKNGNIGGMLEGITRSITGWFTGFGQWHDNKLATQIEELQKHVKKIEDYTETISKARERALGYDSKDVLSQYQNMWNGSSSTDAAANAMREYYAAANGGITGYQQEYELLLEKRRQYIDMYNAEADKKDESEEQLEEYASQIADLDDQIAYFTEDLAKDLWSIDVQDWADQFADALSSAWENGTSAAEAYGDTVTSILQTVGKQMLQEGIMEQMFSNLETTLFGEDGKGGLFDMSDVNGSMPKVVDYLSKYFGDGGEGQQTITAATEFWNGIEQVLNQYGLTAKNTASSSLSTGISGMSENTADILAGYINALRQDVSVMRILQQTFYNQYWPDYKEAYTSAYRSVANIEQDVAAMRRVQGDMADTLSDFYSKFRNVTNGTDKVYVQ